MDNNQVDLNHIPLIPPIPPRVSNFVDPQTLRPTIIAISTICLALMLPFAALRIYCKAWLVRSLSWDDGSCILAIIGSVAYAAVGLSSLNVTGVHVWDVPISAFTSEIMRKQIIGYEISYGPVIFFTKLSLLLLYLRIFSPDRGVRHAIYFGMIANLVFYSVTTIIFGVLCIPRDGEGWMQTLQSARCRKTYSMDYAQGIFGLISDIYIFILPMPIVFKLHMPLRKKIGVAAIFATGFLACLASVIGLWLRIVNFTNPDSTYTLGQTLIAVVVETNIGVICACAPSVGVFLRHHPVNLSALSWERLRAKRSKQSSLPNGFNRVHSFRSKDIRLETQILASSAKGEGKFMKPQDLEWQQSQGASTAEAWAN